MAWKMDNPLYSMADDAENEKAMQRWEGEKHGGLWEGNNRLPLPCVFLLGLIIVTAFLVTMPIWGLRPTAELYWPLVEKMDSPEVMALETPEEKMDYLVRNAREVLSRGDDSRLPGLLDRHAPSLTWYDLQLIAPKIREIAVGGGPYGLESYIVVYDQVALANFEGAYRDDGLRQRTQPWWDKGYTIDLFYVSYFCLAMVIVCKRLPNWTRKPNMKGA